MKKRQQLLAQAAAQEAEGQIRSMVSAVVKGARNCRKAQARIMHLFRGAVYAMVMPRGADYFFVQLNFKADEPGMHFFCER